MTIMAFSLRARNSSILSDTQRESYLAVLRCDKIVTRQIGLVVLNRKQDSWMSDGTYGYGYGTVLRANTVTV